MNLCYTICFDPPRSGGCRQMAKMLAASVARTVFEGEFVIFRNSPEPLFLVQREGISEYYVETGDMEGEELQACAMGWKAKARQFIDPRRYERILFVDADCLLLRNVDHLLSGHPEAGDDWDILYQEEGGRSIREAVFHGYLTDEELRGKTGERDGINSGTLAVRAEIYNLVMEEWERITHSSPVQPTKWREQSAWNRLVLDAREKYGWHARGFEAGEIQFPLHRDHEWKKYREAAILHCMGGDTKEKIEFMFGIYMQKFFHDPKGTMVGLLDM